MSMSIDEIKLLLIQSRVQYRMSLIPDGHCCFGFLYSNKYVGEDDRPEECDDCIACRKRYVGILTDKIAEEVMAL